MTSRPHAFSWALCLAAAVCGLVPLALTGCGDDRGAAPASPTPLSSSSPPRPADGAWTPRLVLTPSEIDEIRAHLDAGDEPWASAWRVFLDERVDASFDDAPSVARGPYRGGGDIHDAFRALDGDSRDARDFGIAYALSGDRRYARRARDVLVAWATGSTPTRLRDHDSPDTGQLQSWGAFSFAYAYDLTRASGVYARDDARRVEAYFARFTIALREALGQVASDPLVGTDERRPYEWTDRLTYRLEDRIIGGDFCLAIETALVALATETEDEATLRRVLTDPGNPLRADRAVAHALRPDNDGDGRGTRPVPEVLIMKMYSPERGGTVDYMTYNARLATLLCEVAASVDPGLGRSARPRLTESWLYLSRFFGDGAARSPNPADKIDAVACLPRFVPAYRAVRDPRLFDVAASGHEARYYEPQFLGPVTLTHWWAR